MKRTFLVLLALVFIYPMISIGAEKDSVSVKLVWEKEFPHPVKDFSLAEKKGIPALQTIITTNEIIFGEGKGAKRINVSGFLSPNGEYIGVKKVHYGDKDDILPGSKFYIYDRKGNLVLERDVKGDYEPGTILLNNGAFIISPSDFGAPAKAILEQLDGSQKVILDCKKCDMMPSGHTAVAKKAPLFVSNLSGIGVLLYNNKGYRLWKRKLDPGCADLVAISPYGKYIAALGKGVVWLYEFNRKGDLLWELHTGVIDNVLKFSPSENYIIASGSTDKDLMVIDTKNGSIAWKYTLPEERYWYSVNATSNDDFVIAGDGLGDREKPQGKETNIYLFDKYGNILWKNQLKNLPGVIPQIKIVENNGYFIISAGKKIYCYEIRGIK